MYKSKRAFDFILGTCIFLVSLPVLMIVALLVRVNLGKPVFFLQMRPGLNGTPFRFVKFRTMQDLVDANGNPLPDHLRLTRFGILLRSTSLDELPSILNVLRGDMSLVGPRPLLMRYVPLYSTEQARRMAVLPGITGWAQINGRNLVNWEDRFKMDCWYVDHCSLFLDLKILVNTIGKVFLRSGVSHAEHATMPEFKGSAVTENNRP